MQKITVLQQKLTQKIVELRKDLMQAIIGCASKRIDL